MPLHKIHITNDDGYFTVINPLDRSYPTQKGRAFTVRYQFQFKENTHRSIRGQVFNFKKGQSINLGYSVKYDIDFLKEIIQKNGLVPKKEYVSSDKYYGAVLAMKESP